MRQLLSTWLAAVFLLAGSAMLSAEVQAQEESAVMPIEERVNINEADAEAIAAVLHRVGVKRAEAIVEWRDTNGPFTAVDQLLEIRGIGSTILEDNRDRVEL